MIKIESGIPIPEPRGKEARFPFRDMKVGDSFLTKVEQRLVAAAASDYGRRNGIKFATRKVLGGTRCWRTE